MYPPPNCDSNLVIQYHTAGAFTFSCLTIAMHLDYVSAIKICSVPNTVIHRILLNNFWKKLTKLAILFYSIRQAWLLKLSCRP